jgi:hypothetical protein
MRAAALSFLVIAGAGSTAADLESLHIANVGLSIGGRTSVQLHSRFRTNHRLGDFYQVRGGPVVQVRAAARTTLIGGYYFIEQEDSSHRLYDQHRAFGGVQQRTLDHRRVKLDVRWMGERFFAGPVADYWRLRNRLMATLPRDGWAPFVSGEALWVQNARWIGRYSAGAQRRIGAATVGLGYEFRQSVTGTGSHIMATYFQFDALKPKR